MSWMLSILMVVVNETSNLPVDLAPFGRWTSRDKAARGRSPTR